MERSNPSATTVNRRETLCTRMRVQPRGAFIDQDIEKTQLQTDISLVSGILNTTTCSFSFDKIRLSEDGTYVHQIFFIRKKHTLHQAVQFNHRKEVR